MRDIQSRLLRGFWRTTWLIVMMCALGAGPALAQTNFNSGSDGTYGAMNITNDTTLDMPANGIFNCTSIYVDSGVTLTFRRNPLNTPVYLLARTNVVVNGLIDVSGSPPNGGAPGLGGPGGFDGGYGGYALFGPGDGKGPGAGIGDHRPARFNYGNALCVPLIGGSGGAGQSGSPGPGGGGGGGAILIASSRSITIGSSGEIRSWSGRFVGYGEGTAGAIRLVAPLIDGSGILNVDGYCYYDCGDGGRIRLDCLDRFAFRNLRWGTSRAASGTRGSQMYVFPPGNPHLDIIEAAGQSIPPGTTNGVTLTFPPGPDTNITVRVQATNFTNTVPIRVVVTPENSPSSSYDAAISMSQGNPASTNVVVTVPTGMTSTIHAWTR